ncbi:hypothetical protein D3C71_1534550 [compost metagenome]
MRSLFDIATKALYRFVVSIPISLKVTRVSDLLLIFLYGGFRIILLYFSSVFVVSSVEEYFIKSSWIIAYVNWILFLTHSVLHDSKEICKCSKRVASISTAVTSILDGFFSFLQICAIVAVVRIPMPAPGSSNLI